MTNYQIRENARNSLGGGIFSRVWLLAVLACFVYSAVAGISGAFYVGILLLGPLSYGLNSVFLDLARGRGDVEIEDLFSGFKNFTNTLVLGLLQFVYVFLWTLILVIPGIVKSYSYAMSYFVMKDHPEYTPSQCITESRRLMHGKKFKLFLLDLSFIGWAILCVFTFGLGSFWLSAYMQASRAHFYKMLIDAQKAEESEKEASAESENA